MTAAASLWASGDFRRLWTIGLFTFVVRWLEMLAMGLYAWQVTHSAFVVAMLSMLRLLPMALFGAIMGAAAERFERRRVLTLTLAVSMASTLTLGVLASLGMIAVWQLAVASFINGSCWATDNPVRRMMIGDAVGPERMGRAMSFDIGTNNASRILGPTLSGLLLAHFGIAGVFWCGVLLYAAGIALVFGIRGSHAPHRTPQQSFFASVAEGFRYVRGDPRLIGVLMITVIFNVFGWPVTSMVPVIGTDYLNLDPKGVGLLASAEGAGGLLGAVLMGLYARPAWYGRIYVGAVGIYLAMVIGFALAPWTALSTVLLIAIGTSGVGFSVMQATLVYRDAPPEMRARLLGVLSVFIGSSPIGFTWLGFLAEVTTPRVALVLVALQGFVAMWFARRYWLLSVRAR